MRAVAVLGLLSACGSDPSPVISIHAPADLEVGTSLAVTDLVRDLGRITVRETVQVTSPASCVDGELHIALAPRAASGEQTYTIDETRCDDGGKLVTLAGGSQLAEQWAIYDLLERLGVRYLHPEQTAYPTIATWPAEPFDVTASPSFERRSYNAHRTHPIELSAPDGATAVTMGPIQKRWIDWNVKIRSTDVGGWDALYVGTYAFDRGFPRGAGINLLNGQQGGMPVIDPDDPRPEHDQIAEAIDEQMADAPGQPPVAQFSFQFNPNEFTTADEALTVDRITFVTEYINERWPSVEVRTINHGTHQGPGPTYGVRFFDLSQFAPASLGVYVHSLMFYGLDRPAPVYGNSDFGFFRAWIEQEQAVRRITWYPESSWWLTFDLPVPLYLAPVTLEARGRDLEILKPWLAELGADHGVVGHHTFSSGQEWGYWLIDYCSARMSWDIDLGWVGCLEHVAAPFAQGAELAALWREVGEAQAGPLRDPGVLAMLVGSDDETEAAALAGIDFHPLPPSPASVLGYDDTQVAALRAASLDKLPALIAQYTAWADRAEALAAAQSPEHAPWLREVADGLRITGLRAAHAQAVYSIALELRAAIAAQDVAAIQAAEARVPEVVAITEQARAIVTRREADYRYDASLTIGGDEPGSPGAVPNATVYPYRYLSRTHRLFYWTRPDEQVAAMFSADIVKVADRMVLTGTPLDVTVLADDLHDIAIDWGDSTTSTTLAPHTYAAPGVYAWTMDAIHAGGIIQHVDTAAMVATRADFAAGSLQIQEPMGAEIIEGLLPGLAVGAGTDTTGDFFAVGTLLVDGSIARASLARAPRTGMTSAPFDLPLTLAAIGHITAYGAVLTVSGATLSLTGELSTDEIIALVVSTGAFDEAGARDVVAAQLGYTAETLPARVAFRITAP